MKLNISAALVAAALASVAAPADPLDSVDTLIGGSYRGHTFPVLADTPERHGVS